MLRFFEHMRSTNFRACYALLVKKPSAEGPAYARALSRLAFSSQGEDKHQRKLRLIAMRLPGLPIDIPLGVLTLAKIGRLALKGVPLEQRLAVAIARAREEHGWQPTSQKE